MEAWVYIPKNLSLEKQVSRKASTLQQREVKETKIYTSPFTRADLQVPQRLSQPETEKKNILQAVCRSS